MATYTLHVEFTAPANAADAVDSGRIITKDLAERFGVTINADTWDVSGVDDTGAQDWSTIIPRVTA